MIKYILIETILKENSIYIPWEGKLPFIYFEIVHSKNLMFHGFVLGCADEEEK